MTFKLHKSILLSQPKDFGGEIRLYGPIDEGLEEKFIDELKHYKNKAVVVRINSPGGLVDTALMIYEALQRYKGPVVTVVDSLAASAGTIIALAGGTRLTVPSGRWMIHQASATLSGNSNELRKVAKVLDLYDETIAEIYSRVMRPGTDIRGMMEREQWFNAKQAVDIGLSTGLAQSKKPVALSRSR